MRRGRLRRGRLRRGCLAALNCSALYSEIRVSRERDGGGTKLYFIYILESDIESAGNAAEAATAFFHISTPFERTSTYFVASHHALIRSVQHP